MAEGRTPALRGTHLSQQQQFLGQASNTRFQKGLVMLLLLLMHVLLLLNKKQAVQHSSKTNGLYTL